MGRAATVLGSCATLVNFATGVEFSAVSADETRVSASGIYSSIVLPTAQQSGDVAIVLPPRKAPALRRPVWGRSQRVLYALAAIWVLNFFDLGFTITESKAKLFRELNPLAATMMDHPHALVLYKTSLVVIGSWLLLRYRRRRLTELACWLLLATNGYVGIRWQQYYADVLVTFHDPCVIYETQATCRIP